MDGPQPHLPPPTWLLPVWTVLWLGAAIFQALPGQNSGADVAAIISESAASAPGGALAHLSSKLAT